MSFDGQRMIPIEFSAEMVEHLLDTWSAPVQIRIVKSGDQYEMQGRAYPQDVDDGPTARLARESLQRGWDEYCKTSAEESARDRLFFDVADKESAKDQVR